MDRHDYYSGNSNTHISHHQHHTNSQPQPQQHHHHQQQQHHLQQQPLQQHQQHLQHSHQLQQHQQHLNNTAESQLNASVKPVSNVQQVQQLQPQQPHHVHHIDLQHPLQHQSTSSTHQQQQQQQHLHQQSHYALPHLSAADASSTTSIPSNTIATSVANNSSVITAQPNLAYDVFDGFGNAHQHQHQHQHQQQQQPIEPVRPGSESNTPMDYSDTAVASVASVASVTSVASTDLAAASKTTPPAQQQPALPAYTLSYPAAIESPTVAGAGIDGAKLTPAPIASASSTTSSLSAVALSPAVGAGPLGSDNPNAYIAGAGQQHHQLQPQSQPLAQQHQTYNQHLPAYEHAQYHAKAVEATAAFPPDAAKQQVYPAFRAQSYAPGIQQQQQQQHQYQSQQSIHQQQQQMQQLQQQQQQLSQQQQLQKNQMISPGDSAKAQSKLLPAFASFGGGSSSSGSSGSSATASNGRHMPQRGFADELIITSQQTGRAYLYQQQHQHQLHQQQQQQQLQSQHALLHQQHQQSRSQHKPQTLHQPQAVHSDPSSRNPNASAFSSMQQSAFYTPQTEVPPYTISVQHAQHQQPSHLHSQQQPQHPLMQLQHPQKQQQYQQYASHSANRHAYVSGTAQQQHGLNQHPQHPQTYTHAQRLYAAQQQQQHQQQQQSYQSHSAHRNRGAAHPYKIASTHSQPHGTHESVDADPLAALAGNIRGYQHRPAGYGNYFEGQQQHQAQPHHQQQTFPHAPQQLQPLQQALPQQDYGPSGTVATSATHLQTHYPTKSSNVIFAPCTTTATQPTNTSTFGSQQPHANSSQQQQQQQHPVANVHLQPRQPTTALAAAAAYQQQQHLPSHMHHHHQQAYHPAAGDQHYHQLQPHHHQSQQRISSKAYSSQHLQHSQSQPHHPHLIQQQAEKVYSLHPTAIVGVGTHLHHHHQQQPTQHPHQPASQHHHSSQLQPHMMYPTAMNGHTMDRYSGQQHHAQLQLQYQQQQLQRQQQQHLQQQQQQQHQHQQHQTYEKRLRVPGPTEIIDLEEQIDYSKIIKPRSAEYSVDHHLLGKQMVYESNHLQHQHHQQQHHQQHQQHQQHMPQPTPLNGYARYDAYEAASPYQRTCDPTVGGGVGGLRDYLSTWNEFADDDEEEGSAGLAAVTLEPTSDNEKAIAQQLDAQLLAKSAETVTSAASIAVTSDKDAIAAGNLPDILADIDKQKESTESATGPLIVYERIPVDLADLEKYKHLSILNKLPDYVVQLPSLPTLVDDPQMPIVESASAKVVEESLRIIEDVASTRAKEKSDFERNVQYDEDFINSVEDKRDVTDPPQSAPVAEDVSETNVQTDVIPNSVEVPSEPVGMPDTDTVVQKMAETGELPIDLAVGNVERSEVGDTVNAITELVSIKPTPAPISCTDVEVAKKFRKRLHKKTSHHQQRRNSTSSSSPPTVAHGHRRSAPTMVTTTVDDIIDYKCFGSAGASVTESDDDCEAGNSSELLSSSPTTPVEPKSQKTEEVRDQPDNQLPMNGNLFRPMQKNEVINDSTQESKGMGEREPRLRSKKYRNRRKEAAQRQREEEAEDRSHYLQIATLQRLCVDAFNTKEFRRFMKSADLKSNVDSNQPVKPTPKEVTQAVNEVHPLCASLAPVAASNSNDVMFRVSPMRFMGLDVDASVLPDLTALMTENCEQFNVDSGDDYDALDCLANGTNGLSTTANHLEVKFAQYNDTLREMDSVKRMVVPRAVRHNSFGSDFFDSSSLAFVMGASGQMHSSDSLFPDPPNRIVETPPPCNQSEDDENLRGHVDEEMPTNNIDDDRLNEGPITNSNLFLTNGLEEDSQKETILETCNVGDLSKATAVADLSSVDLETTTQPSDFPYDLSLAKNLETDIEESFKHTPQTSTPIGEIDFDGMQLQDEIEQSASTEMENHVSENQESCHAAIAIEEPVPDDHQTLIDECVESAASTYKSAVLSSNHSSRQQDDSASSSSSDNSSSSSSESDTDSSDDENNLAVKPPVLNAEARLTEKPTTSDQTRLESAHQLSDYQRSSLSESDDSDEELVKSLQVTSKMEQNTSIDNDVKNKDEIIGTEDNTDFPISPKHVDEADENRMDVNVSNITESNVDSNNVLTPQSNDSQRSSLSESNEGNRCEPSDNPNTSTDIPQTSTSSGLSESVCSEEAQSITSSQTRCSSSVADSKSPLSESESEEEYVNNSSTPSLREWKPASPQRSRHSMCSSSSSNSDTNSDDSDEDFDARSVPQTESHIPISVQMNEELQLSSSESEDECFGTAEINPSEQSPREESGPAEHNEKTDISHADEDREAETHTENNKNSDLEMNVSISVEKSTDPNVDTKLANESTTILESQEQFIESLQNVEDLTREKHTLISTAEKVQEEESNITEINEDNIGNTSNDIIGKIIESSTSIVDGSEIVETEKQNNLPNETMEENAVLEDYGTAVDKLENEIEHVKSVPLDNHPSNDILNGKFEKNPLFEENCIAEENLGEDKEDQSLVQDDKDVAEDTLANTVGEKEAAILENQHNKNDSTNNESTQSDLLAEDTNLSELQIDETIRMAEEIVEDKSDNIPADRSISSPPADENVGSSCKPFAVDHNAENTNESNIVQSESSENLSSNSDTSPNVLHSNDAVPTPTKEEVAEKVENEVIPTSYVQDLELEDGEIFEEEDVDADTNIVYPSPIAQSEICYKQHAEGTTMNIADIEISEADSVENEVEPLDNQAEIEVAVAVNGIEQVSSDNEKFSEITNEECVNKIELIVQEPLEQNIAINNRFQDDKSLESVSEQTTSISEDLIEVRVESSSVVEKSVLTIEQDKFDSVPDNQEHSTSALESIGVEMNDGNVIQTNISGADGIIESTDAKSDIGSDKSATEELDATTRDQSTAIELHDEESLDPTAMLEAAFDDAFPVKTKNSAVFSVNLMPKVAKSQSETPLELISADQKVLSTAIEQYCPLKSEWFLTKMRQKRENTHVGSTTKSDQAIVSKHRRLSGENSVEEDAQTTDVIEPKTPITKKSPKRSCSQLKKRSNKSGYESDCSISSSTSSSSSSSSSSTCSSSSSSTLSSSSTSSDSEDDLATANPAVLIDDLFSLESEVAPIESHMSHLIAYDTTDNLDILSQSDLDARIDPYRNLDNPCVVLAADSSAAVARIATPDLPTVAMPATKKPSRLDPRLDPARLANDMLALGDCSQYVRKIQTGVEELMSNIVRANRLRNEATAEASPAEPSAQRPAISRPIIDLSDLLLEREISEEVHSILHGTDEEGQLDVEPELRPDSPHRLVEMDVAKLMGELSAGVDLSKVATRPSTPQSINDLLDDLMTHAPADEAVVELPKPEVIPPAAVQPDFAHVRELDIPILPVARAKRAECTETYFELFDEQQQQQLIFDISADLAPYEEVVSDTDLQLAVARDLSALRRRLHAKHRNAALASHCRGHLQLVRKYVRFRVAARCRNAMRTKLAELLKAKARAVAAAVAAIPKVTAELETKPHPVAAKQPAPPPKKKRSSKSESCSTPSVASLSSPVVAKRSSSASSPPLPTTSSSPKSPIKLTKSAASASDAPPKAQPVAKVASTVTKSTRGLVAKRRSTYVDPPAPVGPQFGKKPKPNFEQMLLGIDQFYTKAKSSSSPTAAAPAGGSLNNNSTKISNANTIVAADSAKSASPSAKKRTCPKRRSQSISSSGHSSAGDPGTSSSQQQQSQLKEKITHSRDQVKRLIIPHSKIYAAQPAAMAATAVEAAIVQPPEVAGLALRRMESVRVQIVRSPLVDRLCTLYGMSAGTRRKR